MSVTQCSGDQRSKKRSAGPVDNACELQICGETALIKWLWCLPLPRKSWLYGEKYN